MESKTRAILLPSLAENEDRLFQILPKACSDEAFQFEATGDDPRIFFPKMDLEPVGAVFKLDITLPGAAMVQLFYQTIETSDFSEGQSVSIFHDKGRHCIEWAIDQPLNGFFRLDPGNLAGGYIIHKIEVLQNYHIKYLIPKNITAQKLQYHQIKDLQFAENGLKFKAVGRDPRIVFPKVDLWPKSSTVRLEITLQRHTMVQLYFQQSGKEEFTEEMSVSESKPAGRHTIDWFFDHPLNGVFRLDPGNMPWEYQIHKMNILQGFLLKSIPCDQIFTHGGHINQIEDIQFENGEVSFHAIGEDPYVFLPKFDLQSKKVRICIDITLPQGGFVQLFYQKSESTDFAEEFSCQSYHIAGRNSVEFVITGELNGFFRLDPGNQPGRYVIHKIKYEQLSVHDESGDLSSQWLSLNNPISKLQDIDQHTGARWIAHPLENYDTRLPSVSIIIPVFNQWALTKRCLESLWPTIPAGCNLEVIVIDDASMDETAQGLALMRGVETRMKIIHNKKNTGFVGSCNYAASIATGEILLFLNNDTLLLAGWLSPILHTFAMFPSVGAVGGKLLFPDGRLQEAGGIIFADGTACHFGRYETDSNRALFNHCRQVDYVSGALLATSRSVFEELGGFDSEFSPGYYEDTDYCFRLRERGYAVYYQPAACIVHIEGGTAGTDEAIGMKRHQEINRLRFQARHATALREQPLRPDSLSTESWTELAHRGKGGNIG